MIRCDLGLDSSSNGPVRRLIIQLAVGLPRAFLGHDCHAALSRAGGSCRAQGLHHYSLTGPSLSSSPTTVAA